MMTFKIMDTTPQITMIQVDHLIMMKITLIMRVMIPLVTMSQVKAAASTQIAMSNLTETGRNMKNQKIMMKIVMRRMIHMKMKKLRYQMRNICNRRGKRLQLMDNYNVRDWTNMEHLENRMSLIRNKELQFMEKIQRQVMKIYRNNQLIKILSIQFIMIN